MIDSSPKRDFRFLTGKQVVISTALIASVLLAGCAGQPTHRKDLACLNNIDDAYKALNYAKAQGFSGTVAYTKAGSLLAAAKVQQQVEKYDGCLANVEKARFYIRQSQNK